MLRKKSDFFELYQTLLTRGELTRAQAEILLSAAVVFLNQKNVHLVELGYRIVVMYANLTKDYIPLYDIALGRGFMPIVASIEYILAKDEKEKHFFPEFFSSLLESYKVDEAVLTEQQLDLGNFFTEHKTIDVTVTAPTSYGKSELISTFFSQNLRSNICIIVPTKALVAQTRQRLLSKRRADDKRQIITHAEMLQNKNNNFVAVFTQERFMRFLIKHRDIDFDFIFVDEAHNLLNNEARALLLAKVVIMQKRRNPSARFKYLTPFLVDQANLQLRYAEIDPQGYQVKEGLKTERYYIVDCKDGKPVQLYDQYFDRFIQYSKNTFNNEFDIISAFSAKKNIIFFNSPKKIEIFTRNFVKKLPPIDNNSIIRACKSISEFLHKEYLLVECLSKGVIYHHGSIPDIVKLYIERAYAEIPEIRHIVCNSTLLEGVNIPAEKMFIFENKKGRGNLKKSQFRNLVGRVCRFNEIFKKGAGSLDMLEPEIFLVKTATYLKSDTNLESFIKTVAQVDLKLEDEVENVLLENATLKGELKEKQKLEADEFLENVLPGTTGEGVARTVTPVGRACFLNNIIEIDVMQNEVEIQNIIDKYGRNLQSSNEVMRLIATAFVPYLKKGKSFEVLRRLEEESAQTFYSMLIDWKIKGASYAEMIRNFLRYWDNSKTDEVYVGKWGEFAREGSFGSNWVFIREKSHAEKVNLAIVRIKEEQDFVDNYLLKYVELLHDIEKIDESLYLQIKYGTTDQDKIRLMNLGVNSTLAGKLIDKYASFVELRPENGDVELRSELIERMRKDGENEILVFEAGIHMGIKHVY